MASKSNFTLLACGVFLCIFATVTEVAGIKELSEQTYPFEFRKFKSLVTPVPAVPTNETVPARIARAFSTRKIGISISEGAVYVDIWATTPEDKHCKREVPPTPKCVPTDVNATQGAPVSCPAAASTIAASPSFICDAKNSPCLFDVDPALAHCVRLQNATEAMPKGEARTWAHTEFHGFWVGVLFFCIYKLAQHARTAPNVRKSFAAVNLIYYGLIFYTARQLYDSAPFLRPYTDFKYLDYTFRALAVVLAGLGIYIPISAWLYPHRGGWRRMELGQACGYAIATQYALLAVKWWPKETQYGVIAAIAVLAFLFYCPRRLWNVIRTTVAPTTNSEFAKLHNFIKENPEFLAKFPGKTLKDFEDNHPDRLKEKFASADRTTLPVYPEPEPKAIRRTQAQSAPRTAAQ